MATGRSNTIMSAVAKNARIGVTKFITNKLMLFQSNGQPIHESIADSTARFSETAHIGAFLGPRERSEANVSRTVLISKATVDACVAGVAPVTYKLQNILKCDAQTSPSYFNPT